MSRDEPKSMYSADAFAGVSVPKSSKDRRAEVRLSKRAAERASELQDDGISPLLVSAYVRLADFAIIALVGFLVLWGAPAGREVMAFPAISGLYSAAILLTAFLAVLAFQVLDCYQVQTMRSMVRLTSRVIAGWTTAFAVLATLAFLTKLGDSFSRVWFGTYFIAGLLLLGVVRAAISVRINNLAMSGKLERRAVIVGGGKAADDFINQLEAQGQTDVRIVGIFDDRDASRAPVSAQGFEKLGTVAELVEFGRKTRIDMLIVTLPVSAEKRVLQLLKQLWVLPVDIRLAAHTNKLRFRPRSYSWVGQTPMLDLFDKPIADIDSLTKRVSDIVLSLFFIVLLSPLMLATAIAIRLESKGPMIFRQKRHGFNNEEVEVLKFRSMYHEMSDPDAKVYVTKGDPRVTKVGRFIRKTSIDELPQFFNVLRGNLSLVGPRPHAVTAHMHDTPYAQVVDGYFARHKVKPGVTGWAQVNGLRGEVDRAEKIQGRVDHDLYYIENWSLPFDLYIIAITPWKLLFDRENAY
ncbi:MAG: undecaprenyl-phosphate glucose phosphotransferase [Pseudomonadota bacterium]